MQTKNWVLIFGHFQLRMEYHFPETTSQAVHPNFRKFTFLEFLFHWNFVTLSELVCISEVEQC